MGDDFIKYLVAASTTGGKFWEVKVVGDEMFTRNGKVGQEKEWSSKVFPSPEKALKSAQSKIKAKLNKGYAETSRPMEISTEFKNVDLSTIPLGGEFYFRAMNRYPGGNADMFTIKILLTSIPNQEAKLTAQSYNNWDGEHWTYPEAELKLDMTETLPKLLINAQKLINSDLNDGSFTILDNRYDDEEYDTEWSFLEFSLVALPEGSTDLTNWKDGKSILKLVQKAVYNGAKTIDADDDSKAFMESVHKLVGIDRVEQCSENEDAFSEAYRVDGTSKGYKDTDVPLYL